MALHNILHPIRLNGIPFHAKIRRDDHVRRKNDSIGKGFGASVVQLVLEWGRCSARSSYAVGVELVHGSSSISTLTTGRIIICRSLTALCKICSGSSGRHSPQWHNVPSSHAGFDIIQHKNTLSIYCLYYVQILLDRYLLFAPVLV